jgi:integrase
MSGPIPLQPRTLERYEEVLAHFERILPSRKYVETVTRSDIDDYKVARSRETVGSLRRPVSPATVNFEVTVLKTFFYYLIRERGIEMENPCARSKVLRAEKERLKRRPPNYTRHENQILAASDKSDRAIFATLLLTGLRKEELGHLAWSDLDLQHATLRLTAKDGFAPKDYEEREIPLPPILYRSYATCRGTRIGFSPHVQRSRRQPYTSFATFFKRRSISLLPSILILKATLRRGVPQQEL